MLSLGRRKVHYVKIRLPVVVVNIDALKIYERVILSVYVYVPESTRDYEH